MKLLPYYLKEEDIIEQLQNDIKRGRMSMSEGASPRLGRVDVYGKAYYESFEGWFMRYREIIGISSVEQLSGYTCVTFINGRETETINLDDIPKLCKIPAYKSP
ncbi:hypothetical protein KW805_03440 [Candidatus Pacearchaeota archaeon]|nr:hypothetical protein [Candidatus Pacearchaeota archaeon]